MSGTGSTMVYLEKRRKTLCVLRVLYSQCRGTMSIPWKISSETLGHFREIPVFWWCIFGHTL